MAALGINFVLDVTIILSDDMFRGLSIFTYLSVYFDIYLSFFFLYISLGAF